MNKYTKEDAPFIKMIGELLDNGYRVDSWSSGLEADYIDEDFPELLEGSITFRLRELTPEQVNRINSSAKIAGLSVSISKNSIKPSVYVYLPVRGEGDVEDYVSEVDRELAVLLEKGFPVMHFTREGERVLNNELKRQVMKGMGEIVRISDEEKIDIWSKFTRCLVREITGERSK